ncbi:phosphotransferase family protein [Chelativorans sp. Marseille-P2723]|uniref:phosphotransferase family protein n=1 Tax=Chelativorans sp. Marseille-P2723 TaxID=2709133 RepID=UPI00156E5DA9|nr:phosphotransferase family protein [Chelativorans sp. Marseille-P2723]
MTSSVVDEARSSDGRGAFGLDVEAVALHLAQHGIELDRAAGAIQLSGGLSNLNYLVRVNGEKAVLRRPPMGDLPPGAHDMVREHRVLSRLGEAFPQAPRSFHLCDELSVIGVPFQLLEYRSGLSIRGDKLPPEFDAQMCNALSISLVETLAALHAVDAEAVGLGDFGRPEGFFARTTAGWMRRGAAVAQDDSTLKAIEKIGTWLERKQPEALPPTLLHSDFKLDNCMLGENCRITTVLDWDMGTRGDPLMDLATLLSYWTEPADPECMHLLAQMPTANPGFLSRAQVADAYARATGRPIDDLPVWRILAMLKLGVVFLQLHRNWVNGIAGDDAYAGFARLGADLIDFTLASLDQPL